MKKILQVIKVKIDQYHFSVWLQDLLIQKKSMYKTQIF